MELLQSQEYKNIKTTTAAENKIYLYLFHKEKVWPQQSNFKRQRMRKEKGRNIGSSQNFPKLKFSEQAFSSLQSR